MAKAHKSEKVVSKKEKPQSSNNIMLSPSKPLLSLKNAKVTRRALNLAVARRQRKVLKASDNLRTIRLSEDDPFAVLRALGLIPISNEEVVEAHVINSETSEVNIVNIQSTSEEISVTTESVQSPKNETIKQPKTKKPQNVKIKFKPSIIRINLNKKKIIKKKNIPDKPTKNRKLVVKSISSGSKKDLKNVKSTKSMKKKDNEKLPKTKAKASSSKGIIDSVKSKKAVKTPKIQIKVKVSQKGKANVSKKLKSPKIKATLTTSKTKLKKQNQKKEQKKVVGTKVVSEKNKKTPVSESQKKKTIVKVVKSPIKKKSLATTNNVSSSIETFFIKIPSPKKTVAAITDSPDKSGSKKETKQTTLMNFFKKDAKEKIEKKSSEGNSNVKKKIKTENMKSKSENTVKVKECNSDDGKVKNKTKVVNNKIKKIKIGNKVVKPKLKKAVMKVKPKHKMAANSKLKIKINFKNEKLKISKKLRNEKAEKISNGTVKSEQPKSLGTNKRKSPNNEVDSSKKSKLTQENNKKLEKKISKGNTVKNQLKKSPKSQEASSSNDTIKLPLELNGSTNLTSVNEQNCSKEQKVNGILKTNNGIKAEIASENSEKRLCDLSANVKTVRKVGNSKKQKSPAESNKDSEEFKQKSNENVISSDTLVTIKMEDGETVENSTPNNISGSPVVEKPSTKRIQTNTHRNKTETNRKTQRQTRRRLIDSKRPKRNKNLDKIAEIGKPSPISDNESAHREKDCVIGQKVNGRLNSNSVEENICINSQKQNGSKNATETLQTAFFVKEECIGQNCDFNMESNVPISVVNNSKTDKNILNFPIEITAVSTTDGSNVNQNSRKRKSPPNTKNVKKQKSHSSQPKINEIFNSIRGDDIFLKLPAETEVILCTNPDSHINGNKSNSGKSSSNEIINDSFEITLLPTIIPDNNPSIHQPIKVLSVDSLNNREPIPWNPNVPHENIVSERILNSVMSASSGSSNDSSSQSDTNSPSKRIRCKACDVTFTSVKEYHTHRRQYHPRSKLHTCKICGEQFPSRSQQRNHKAKFHEGDQPYNCKKCGQSFDAMENLISHYRTHEGKLPFDCKVCKQSFETKLEHTQHMIIHKFRKVDTSNKKILRCEHCDQEFYRGSDRQRHLRTHSGEKPYMCQICNARFVQAHNLTKHLVIHTREKNYECELCGKKFGRSDVLSRHMNTHSLDKPFHCQKCNKNFGRVSQLNCHITKYHPVTES